MRMKMSSPAAPGTGPASCGVGPRRSPGRPSHGPECSVCSGCPGWRSAHGPAAADRTARRPGRFRHERRSRCGAPVGRSGGTLGSDRTRTRTRTRSLQTWCRSSRASAPVTSLASSSEDTRPRIPLIQDIRSLWKVRTRSVLVRFFRTPGTGSGSGLT